jgi:non-specific serine/threonine protein kinase
MKVLIQFVLRDSTTPSIVAIKIIRADMTTDSRELKIITHVREFSDEPDRLVKLISNFVHTGINGRHQCLVFEPMGLTASWLILDHDALTHTNDACWRKLRAQRYSRGKSALKCLLLSLHNLHSCGVASGNLHPRNPMAILEKTLNEESVPLLLAHPTENTIARHVVRTDGLVDPWAPKHIIRKLPLRESMEVGPLPTMKLGGLGSGKSHGVQDAS